MPYIQGRHKNFTAAEFSREKLQLIAKTAFGESKPGGDKHTVGNDEFGAMRTHGIRGLHSPLRFDLR